MIRFIFKSSIFIIIALVIISFFAPASKNSDDTNFNVFATLGAIRETIADLGNFCDRNAETCDTGKEVISSIGDRVRDGAKVTYDYIGTKVTKDDPKESKNSKDNIKANTEADTQTDNK